MARKEKRRKQTELCTDIIRFELPPMSGRGVSEGSTHAPSRLRRPHWTQNYRKSNYDSDCNQFMQSCYQFLVPTGVRNMDWSLVIGVCVYDCDDLICPICLQEPAAGRITRCGHIYCYPCILQYFCLDDSTEMKIAGAGMRPHCEYLKCPVCSKHIQLSTLKPVTYHRQEKFKEGMKIDMLLMHRSDSGYVEPVVNLNETELNRVGNFPEEERTSTMPLNGPFIETIDSSQCRKTQILKDQTQLEFRLQCDMVDQSILSIHFDNVAIDLLKKEFKEEVNTISNYSFDSFSPAFENVTTISPSTSETYFYQAVDGQRIFLHSLNVKCLLKEYGRFDQCPISITDVPIVAIERKHLTHDITKRYRYLNHLPMGSEIRFVEVDLSKVLSNDTLLFFEGHIRNRRFREAKERYLADTKRSNAIDEEMFKLYEALNVNCEHYRPSPVLPSSEIDEHFPTIGRSSQTDPNLSAPLHPVDEQRLDAASYAQMANRHTGESQRLIHGFSAINNHIDSKPEDSTRNEPGDSNGHCDDTTSDNLITCLGGISGSERDRESRKMKKRLQREARKKRSIEQKSSAIKAIN